MRGPAIVYLVLIDRSKQMSDSAQFWIRKKIEKKIKIVDMKWPLTLLFGQINNYIKDVLNNENFSCTNSWLFYQSFKKLFMFT